VKLTNYQFFFSAGSPFAAGFQETTKQIPGNPNPLGWTYWNKQGGAVQRGDNERLIALRPLAAEFTSLVTSTFPPEVTLTSGPFTQMTDYASVPYFLSRPFDHPANLLMICAWITVHVKTPWPASDAVASISYYIIPSISGRKLALTIDGAWVKQLSGGFLAGDKVVKALGAGAVAAMPQIQAALTKNANNVPGPIRGQYLLPGDGSAAPSATGDGVFDATLALV
jgi:hypothetical protein